MRKGIREKPASKRSIYETGDKIDAESAQTDNFPPTLMAILTGAVYAQIPKDDDILADTGRRAPECVLFVGIK